MRRCNFHIVPNRQCTMITHGLSLRPNCVWAGLALCNLSVSTASAVLRQHIIIVVTVRVALKSVARPACRCGLETRSMMHIRQSFLQGQALAFALHGFATLPRHPDENCHVWPSLKSFVKPQLPPGASRLYIALHNCNSLTELTGHSRS